jgi:hypothetical protein
MVDASTETGEVSDRVRTGLTIAMLAFLAVGAGGLVLGRFDVAAAGGVGLVGSAWILGQLSLRGGSDD